MTIRLKQAYTIYLISAGHGFRTAIESSIHHSAEPPSGPFNSFVGIVPASLPTFGGWILRGNASAVGQPGRIEVWELDRERVDPRNEPLSLRNSSWDASLTCIAIRRVALLPSLKQASLKSPVPQNGFHWLIASSRMALSAASSCGMYHVSRVSRDSILTSSSLPRHSSRALFDAIVSPSPALASARPT